MGTEHLTTSRDQVLRSFIINAILIGIHLQCHDNLLSLCSLVSCGWLVSLDLPVSKTVSLVISYASSSTLHPRQWVSGWVIVSTSVASRLASLIFLVFYYFNTHVPRRPCFTLKVEAAQLMVKISKVELGLRIWGGDWIRQISSMSDQLLSDLRTIEICC